MQSRFINSRAFVRSTMLCSAAVLAIFPVAAMAQTAPAADAADGDAIVVTGSRPIAESEAAALQVQKNSDSIVSVVSSDAAGRLPDQNIAQATGRLPGVAVERDQGQARYISIRGAPNYWTTTRSGTANAGGQHDLSRGGGLSPSDQGRGQALGHDGSGWVGQGHSSRSCSF